MTSQVIFKTDTSVKQAALRKAKREGITLKALLATCLKDYIDGKLKFGVQYYYHEEPEMEIIEVDEETQKKMDEIAQLLN